MCKSFAYLITGKARIRAIRSRPIFIKSKTLLNLYVDDTVLLGPSSKDIRNTIKSLQKDFDLPYEGDLKDYHGVCIEQDGNKPFLTQPRMIECLQSICGFPVLGKEGARVRHDMPAEADAVMQRDTNGKPPTELELPN